MGIAAQTAFALIVVLGLPLSSLAKTPAEIATAKRCFADASELADRAYIYEQDARHMEEDLGQNPTEKAKSEFLKFDAETKERVDISAKIMEKYKIDAKSKDKKLPSLDGAKAHKMKIDDLVAATKACL